MNRITVVCNNVKAKEGFKTAWGLAMLVEHQGERLLFDVGPNLEDLVHNLNKLRIDTKDIDKIIISHFHKDHKGALEQLFSRARDGVKLYEPSSSKQKKEKIANNVYIFLIKGPFSTEQSLVIDSDKGLIILTGCSHPGIYRIARTIKEDFNKNIYAILGGFHLEIYPAIFVKIIGLLLKRLKIKVIGPNHCTGVRQAEVLRQTFKEKFIEFGCGRTFEY